MCLQHGYAGLFASSSAFFVISFASCCSYLVSFSRSSLTVISNSESFEMVALLVARADLASFFCLFEVHEDLFADSSRSRFACVPVVEDDEDIAVLAKTANGRHARESRGRDGKMTRSVYCILYIILYIIHVHVIHGM